MKKINILLVVLLAIIAVTGCDKNKEKMVVTETSSGLYEIIPDPEELFPDLSVSILNMNPGWFITVEDATEDDFQTYVEAAKNAGLIDISYQSDIGNALVYHAYDSGHNYKGEINYMKESSRIDILYVEVDE